MHCTKQQEKNLIAIHSKKDDKQKKSKEGKKKIVWKKDNVYVHEE